MALSPRQRAIIYAERNDISFADAILEMERIQSAQKRTGSSDPAVLLEDEEFGRTYQPRLRDEQYRPPVEDPPVLAQAKALAGMLYGEATPETHPGLFITENGKKRILTPREAATVLRARFDERADLGGNIDIEPSDFVATVFGGKPAPVSPVREALGARERPKVQPTTAASFASEAIYNQDDAVTGPRRKAAELEQQRQQEIASRQAARGFAGNVSEIGGAYIKNFPDRVRTAFWGTINALLERDDAGMMLPGISTLATIVNQVDFVAEAKKRMADQTGRLARGYQERSDANRPDVARDSGWNMAYDVTTAIGDMGLAVSAALATRNPYVGSALIGTQVFGDTYTRSRADGRTPEQAFQHAAVAAAAEFIPETAVMRMIMKPGAQFLKGFGRTGAVVENGVAEAMQEALTEAINIGYETGVLREDMTWGEAMKRLGYSATLGGIAGTTISVPLEAGRAFADRGREPEELPNLSVEDRKSPIPDEIISEGRELTGLDGALEDLGRSRVRMPEPPMAEPVVEEPPAAREPQQIIMLEGPVTSKYGPRKTFKTANGEMASRNHQGVDIAREKGTPIPAAADGVVVFAAERGGYGNYTIIQHADGTRTAYGHQDQINVKVGQQVKQGEAIGTVGESGNATGPHLHFERFDRNGNRVNPQTGGPVTVTEAEDGVTDDTGFETVEEDELLAEEPIPTEDDFDAEFEREQGTSLLAEEEELPVFNPDTEQDEGTVFRDPETGTVRDRIEALRDRLERLAQQQPTLLPEREEVAPAPEAAETVPEPSQAILEPLDNGNVVLRNADPVLVETIQSEVGQGAPRAGGAIEFPARVAPQVQEIVSSAPPAGVASVVNLPPATEALPVEEPVAETPVEAPVEPEEPAVQAVVEPLESGNVIVRNAEPVLIEAIREETRTNGVPRGGAVEFPARVAERVQEIVSAQQPEPVVAEEPPIEEGGDLPVLELETPMPERGPSSLDAFPAEDIANAYEAVANGRRHQDGSVSPVFTKAGEVAVLRSLGVEIDPENLSIPGEVADAIVENGLEGFEPPAVEPPRAQDRGPDAPPEQRFMVQKGNRFGLGATAEEAEADLEAQLAPEPERIAAEQRSEPGEGGFISNLYEAVKALPDKELTLREWADRIYQPARTETVRKPERYKVVEPGKNGEPVEKWVTVDAEGNRITKEMAAAGVRPAVIEEVVNIPASTLPGVKLEELEETGILQLLTGMGNYPLGAEDKVSKQFLLQMIDSSLPYIMTDRLDEEAPTEADLGVGITGPPSPPRHKGYTVDGNSSEGYTEIKFRLPPDFGGNPMTTWSEPHWASAAGGGVNVVVHYRYSLKSTPDNKKVMFLEEVQSQAHSEAKKTAKTLKEMGIEAEGYRGDPAALVEAKDTIRPQLKEAVDKFINQLTTRLHALDDPNADYYADNARRTWTSEAPEEAYRAAKPLVTAYQEQLGDNIIELGELMDGVEVLIDKYETLTSAITAMVSPMTPPKMPWSRHESYARLAMRHAIQEATRIGADAIVWIHGEQYNGGRVEGKNQSDWFYGEKGKAGKYTKPSGASAVAVMPAMTAELIKPMGGTLRHDIPVITPSAVIPPRGIKPKNNSYEYMVAADVLREIAEIEEALVSIRARLEGPTVPNHRDNLANANLSRELEDAKAALAQKTGKVTYSGFDITPRMRAEAKRGMPMFQQGETITVSEMAKVTEIVEKAQAIAKEELSRTGADKTLSLQVGAYFRNLHGNMVKGVYVYGTEPVIKLSALFNTGTEQGYVQTISHEIIHHFRNMKLFSQTEWQGLAQAARLNKNKDGMTYIAWAKKLYPDLNVELQLEEAVAEMYADWRAARTDQGLLARVFARIEEVLRWFAEALRIVDPDGTLTMRKVESGAVGARQPEDTIDIEAESRDQRLWQPSLLERPEVEDGRFGRIGNVFRSVLSMTMGRGEQAVAEFDSWRRKWQDDMIDLRRLQENISKIIERPLTDAENAWVKENLHRSKTATRLEDLNTMQDSILRAMRKSGVSTEMLGKYLAMRHAPHRNARVQGINPRFAEDGGSGYTAEEIDELRAELQDSGKWDELGEVAEMIDALNQFTQKVRREADLLSQEDIDGGFKPEEHYVPLRGIKELDGDLAREYPNVQRGYTVRGRESRRMVGRESRAPEKDILAYVFAQAQEAIIRAEKNEVALSVYELYKLYPDPAFWAHNEVTRRPVFNKKSGTISYRNETRLDDDQQKRSIGFKIDGKQHWLTFNEDSTTALRVVEGLRHMGGQQMNGFVRFFAIWSRLFSRLQTSWNVDFPIKNFNRDLQTGAFNLLSVKDVKLSKVKIVRDAFFGPAFWTAMRGAYSKKGFGSGPWAQVYDDYVAAGGKTVYNQLDPIGEIARKIERATKHPHWYAAHTTAKAFTIDLIDHLNDGIENGIRLSAFKHARDAGMSEQAAADLAKNLTVNFQRHGTAGPNVNAFYPFFNVGIQGPARMAHTFVKRPGLALASAASMMTLNFLLTLLNHAISGEDEDGEKYYDKIDDWRKESSWIIMTPGGDTPAIDIPMGWGLNIFPAMGNKLAEMWLGNKSGLEVAAEGTFSLLPHSFNPLQGETGWNVAAPTVLDPVVNINIRNADFTGRPIVPSQKPRAEDEVPDSQLSWRGTAQYWRDIAETMNRLGGGDEVKSAGALDVSPESIRHVFGYLTGAAGRSVERTVNLFTKEEIGVNDIPVARSFLIDKTIPSRDRSRFHERLAEAERFIADVDKYFERGNQDAVDREMRENPELVAFHDAAVYARKEITRISAASKALRRAEVNAGGLDDKGAEAIGKLYGMDAATAKATVPRGKVPPEIAEQVRAEAKRQEDELVLQFNTAWVRDVEKASRTRKN